MAICFSSIAQPITINFTDSLYAEEDLYHGYVYLNHVNGNKVSIRQGELTFTYPKNFSAEDTAFYNEYFIGYEGKVSRGIGILIANYLSAQPALYVDLNNNLDFSDDGSPVQFSDSTAYLTFRSKSDAEAKFSILYTIAKKDSAHLVFLDKMFQVDKTSKTGKMPSEFWFNAKRHNNKLIKTVLNGDSVKIALHDYNCNGRFDDAGKDLIFINNPEIQFNAFPTSGCITLDSSTTLFSFKDQVYKVVEVDPLGRYLTIEPSNLPYTKPIGPGDKMPDIKLPTANGDSLSLYSLLDGKHYLLIDMWADWCKACHGSAPKLREFADQHSASIKLLGVSPHNLNNAIEKYTTKYEHHWQQALTTPTFMKAFLAEEYPRYILIDPNGQIISLKTHPSSIPQLIKH